MDLLGEHDPIDSKTTDFLELVRKFEVNSSLSAEVGVLLKDLGRNKTSKGCSDCGSIKLTWSVKKKRLHAQCSGCKSKVQSRRLLKRGLRVDSKECAQEKEANQIVVSAPKPAPNLQKNLPKSAAPPKSCSIISQTTKSAGNNRKNRLRQLAGLDAEADNPATNSLLAFVNSLKK